MFLCSNLISNQSGQQMCQDSGSGSGLLTSACVAAEMACRPHFLTINSVTVGTKGMDSMKVA